MSKVKDLFPVPDSHVCLWYYKGDVNHDPRVAIVTSFGKRTGLNLTIFEDGKRELTIVSGARHKDDPFLLDHPTHSQECGCWDYLPGQDPRVVLPQTSATESNAITSGPGSRAFQKK